MEAIAKLKNCPTSPRKMRLVVDQIRMQDVETALNILRYSPKEASRRLEKLLLSGIANWQNKNEGERVEDSELFIKTAFVDGARMLKRFQPRAQGRGFRIRKRSNHVTLVIDSKLPIQGDQIKAIEKSSTEKKETAKSSDAKSKSKTTKATGAAVKSTPAKMATESKKTASAKPAAKTTPPKATAPKSESKAAPKKASDKKDIKKDNGTKS